MDEISLMKKEMIRRRLSTRTIESYCFCLQKFLVYINKDYRKITKKDVVDYLNNLSEKNISGSTLNMHFCSIKFFLQGVMHRNINLNMKFSRRPDKLPVVLTKEEVKRLLNGIENSKHRFMISLMYSAGLRVSELLNLKVEDFDLERNCGWVRNGKGGKDRMFIISEKLKPVLMRIFNDKKQEDFLFTSRFGFRYSIRSIQAIIKKARRKSGIQKKIHPHTLRHSFATHLIEEGYSLTEVQSLLGHKSPETTMIYVHCAAKNMINIKSPFDSL